MIATIKGTVILTDVGSVVVECGGIGYQIFVTSKVVQNAFVGSKVMLYTYMHVKDDGILLFGFSSPDEKTLFERLLAVSGVGPKGALSILSFLGADGLRFAIVSSDAKQISKTPGIGIKTAQKIILEMKDKVNLEDTLKDNSSGEGAGGSALTPAHKEAAMALCALGYGEVESIRAVNLVEASEGLDTDEILKLALKKLL